MYKVWLLVLSLVGIWLMVAASARFGSIEITKILCESSELTTIRFNQCLLQKNKNNIMGIYTIMNHANSTNLLLNFRLLRQSNDKYSPFLYETTIDFCEFLGNPKAKPFWGSVYSLILPYSNFNHTCPYDHDFVIAGFAFEGGDYKLIPTPRGNYKVEMKFAHGLVFHGQVSVFATKF